MEDFLNQTNANITTSFGHHSFYSPPLIAPWFRIFIYIIFIITFLVGTAANILLLYTIYSRKGKRRTIHVFTANLSVSDLMVLVLYLPMELYRIHAQMSWQLGRVPCKLFYGMNAATINANIMTLIAITRDRYVAIMNPLAAHSRASSSVKKWLVVIWIFSTSLASPLLIVVDEKDGVCYEVWPTLAMEQTYWIILFSLHLILPIAYFTFAYSVIVYRMRSQQLPAEVAALYNAMGKCDVVSRNPWNARRKRQQIKLLKIAITLVIAYIVCVTPQHAVFFACIYGTLDVHNENAIYVFLIANFLIIVNSLVNPVIFGVQSREMKRNVANLFCSWLNLWKRVESNRLLSSISSTTSSTAVPNRHSTLTKQISLLSTTG